MLMMLSAPKIYMQTCPPLRCVGALRSANTPYGSIQNPKSKITYVVSSGTTLVAIKAIVLSNNKPTNPTYNKAIII
jgi:hypothetical protein